MSKVIFTHVYNHKRTKNGKEENTQLIMILFESLSYLMIELDFVRMNIPTFTFAELDDTAM